MDNTSGRTFNNQYECRGKAIAEWTSYCNKYFLSRKK